MLLVELPASIAIRVAETYIDVAVTTHASIAFLRRLVPLWAMFNSG